MSMCHQNQWSRGKRKEKESQGKRCGLLRVSDSQISDCFQFQGLIPDLQRCPVTMKLLLAKRGHAPHMVDALRNNLPNQMPLANPNSNEKVRAVNSDILEDNSSSCYLYFIFRHPFFSFRLITIPIILFLLQGQTTSVL